MMTTGLLSTVARASFARSHASPAVTSATLTLCRRYATSNFTNGDFIALIHRSAKFTKDHEWVRIDNDNHVTIGITDYAQNSLGDLVYVELPEPGTSFSQSDEIGIVESVKAASDVYAPVSGEVTEVNQSVVETPSVINKSAQNDGWLVKMKLKEPSELNQLMDEASYLAHCKEAEE